MIFFLEMLGIEKKMKQNKTKQNKAKPNSLTLVGFEPTAFGLPVHGFSMWATKL